MVKKTEKSIEVIMPEFDVIEFTIVGTTPLIVHAWDEKAKRMMLEKQQKTARKKHELKVPRNDFMNSLYWLSEKPKDGIDDESAEEVWEEVKDSAMFGFPLSGIKQAFVTGGARGGLAVKMAELRGAMFLEGAAEGSTFDLARIIGTPPTMREDMVRVGGMAKTADIRYRAQFDEWQIPLRMRINRNGKYSPSQLLSCVMTGGFVTGIGEWRPEKDGQFGMFTLSI